MFTLSKKKGSSGLTLVIGIVGLLLTLLAPPSDALTCFKCEGSPPCKPEDKSCEVGESVCTKTVTSQDIVIKQCSNPTDAIFKKYLGSSGFRGCKKNVEVVVPGKGKPPSTQVMKELCVCDTDKCNVDDSSKYPSSGGSIPGPSLSLVGATLGEAAVLIIAYLNNLFSSAHLPPY